MVAHVDLSQGTLLQAGPAPLPHQEKQTSELSNFNLSPSSEISGLIEQIEHVAANALRTLQANHSDTETLTTQDHLAAMNALKNLDRLVSWAEAMRHILVVSAVGTQPQNLTNRATGTVRTVSDTRALELGAVLGISPTAARNLAAKSRSMVLELVQVQAALRCGSINPYKAHIIHEGAQQLHLKFANAHVELTPAIVNKFQRLVLIRAHQQTASELRRKVNLSVSRLAPLMSQQVNQLEREQRHVTLTPAPDDMAYLTAYLSSHDASRVWQVLSHAAREDSQGIGSTQNRMADALVSIIDGSSELSAENRSHSAEIQIAVSLAELREMSQECNVGTLVGEITSTGMTVTGDMLANLFADSRFRRLLFDDQTGNLLDYGRSTYRPPQNLRSFVQTRDVTCRAPGCVRIARYCDLDHIEPWESGGQTSARNLAALCRTHHLMKTHGGWQYDIDLDGNAQWVLPSGLRTTRMSDSRFRSDEPRKSRKTHRSKEMSFITEDSPDDPPF